MKVIGVTGGVGSGKSVVLDELKTLYNCEVIKADNVAHSLMAKGEIAYNAIVSEFGSEILDTNAEFHKEIMAKLIFTNNTNRKKIDSIVHPLVTDYIVNTIKVAKKENVLDYIFIEAALLIENGFDQICDELWYIYVNKYIRIQRLMSGRGYSREKCISIINSQKTDDFYKMNCKYTIDNSYDLDKTLLDIDNLLKK